VGKPVTRFINQLKTLTPKPAAIATLESLEAGGRVRVDSP
jgi:coatomer protein complex subunit epsilon